MSNQERQMLLVTFRLIAYVLYHLIHKNTTEDASRELKTLDRQIDRWEQLSAANK